MLELAARAIYSLASAAQLDIPAPPDIGSVIQTFAQQFTTMATVALTTVDSAVMIVARLAYASILMIGLVLYYTHVERRLGKDLIKGGILLAVLSEFVFPLISKL